jgi:hypothetical protein
VVLNHLEVDAAAWEELLLSQERTNGNGENDGRA